MFFILNRKKQINKSYLYISRVRKVKIRFSPKTPVVFELEILKWGVCFAFFFWFCFPM